MAIALRRVRGRVQDRIRETSARAQVFNPVEIDNAICDAYLVLQSQLPAPRLYTANAFTISAGGDTFTLPATVTQWTGGDGGAEYAGTVGIRLATSGQFLTPRSVEMIDRLRDGQPTVHLAIPSQFALWEDKNQAVQGRCYPGAEDAQVCDLFQKLSADDMRDFIGTGADDMDDVEVLLSRTGVVSLIAYTSADLLERMTDASLAERGLDRGVSKAWRREASVTLYQEAARRHDLEALGRIERWVS